MHLNAHVLIAIVHITEVGSVLDCMFVYFLKQRMCCLGYSKFVLGNLLGI